MAIRIGCCLVLAFLVMPLGCKDTGDTTKRPSPPDGVVEKDPEESVKPLPEAEVILDTVKSGDPEKVKAILEECPLLVNAKDSNGITPLHTAAFWGHIEIAKYLIRKDGDVNAKDNDGETPLYIAALIGRKEMAEMFIDSGADINVRTNTDTTPLHIAAAGGKKEVVKLLIDKGADVNAKDNEGKTPLAVAIEKGYEDMAELFRKHGGKS